MSVGRIFETTSCKTGEGQGGSYSDPHSRNWALQLDTFSLQSGRARWSDLQDMPNHVSLLQVAQRCVNRVLFGSQTLMLQVECQIELFFCGRILNPIDLNQLQLQWWQWCFTVSHRAQKVVHSSLRLQLPPDPFEDWQESCRWNVFLEGWNHYGFSGSIY